MNIKVKFNFSKLKGKIIEKYSSQKDFAQALGVSRVTVSNKLNNKVPFGQEEIDTICKLLDIQKKDIGDYFFTKRV